MNGLGGWGWGWKGQDALGMDKAYLGKLLALFGSSVVAYWPMSEPSGTVALDASGNGRNGAYTGVTLGASGIGDGRTATSFDGSTSFVNVHSASLAAAFNGSAGTLMVWAKVSGAGVWTDGVARRPVYISDAGGNDRVILLKESVNNAFTWYRQGTGTADSVSKLSFSPTTWQHYALTWSESADELKAYLNGVQEGATQSTLGVFADAITVAIVGASSTVPASVWSGSLAHAVILNRVATPAELALAATIP